MSDEYANLAIDLHSKILEILTDSTSSTDEESGEAANQIVHLLGLESAQGFLTKADRSALMVDLAAYGQSILDMGMLGPATADESEEMQTKRFELSMAYQGHSHRLMGRINELARGAA